MKKKKEKKALQTKAEKDDATKGGTFATLPVACGCSVVLPEVVVVAMADRNRLTDRVDAVGQDDDSEPMSETKEGDASDQDDLSPVPRSRAQVQATDGPSAPLPQALAFNPRTYVVANATLSLLHTSPHEEANRPATPPREGGAASERRRKLLELRAMSAPNSSRSTTPQRGGVSPDDGTVATWWRKLLDMRSRTDRGAATPQRARGQGGVQTPPWGNRTAQPPPQEQIPLKSPERERRKKLLALRSATDRT